MMNGTIWTDMRWISWRPIAWAQMGRLVFGAEDEKRGYQRYASQALHPKTQVVKGILADECAALMKEFFAAKRK